MGQQRHATSLALYSYPDHTIGGGRDHIYYNIHVYVYMHFSRYLHYMGLELAYESVRSRWTA